MNFTPGTWGRYPWFREHGVHLIRPDDLQAFEQLMPHSKLFMVQSASEEYLKILYGQRSYHVKPDLFRRVDTPAFIFGDKVLAQSGSDTFSGEVRGIVWHSQRNEPFYLLTANGKRLKKRYWASDLSLQP